MLNVKLPLFIVGSPRSGTTLLRLMLTSHSKIIIPPECSFITWLYDQYKDWNIKWSQDIDKVQDFTSQLIRARKFENWNLKEDDIINFILDTKPESYSELTECIYLLYAHKKKPCLNVWGDKNNIHLNFLPLLNSLFPDSKFIHIVRDVRDVACSYIKLHDKQINSEYAPKLPHRIKDIAYEWNNNISTIVNSFNNISNKKWIEIRFEDLISQPESTLTSICRFLNLKFEQEMLYYYTLNHFQGMEPAEFMQWKEKNTMPLRKNESGRFKEELNESEIEIFNNMAADLLKRYHYI